MRKWENYFYLFSSALMGALGLLFVIIGSGCLLGSCAAMLVALKRRAGVKAF